MGVFLLWQVTGRIQHGIQHCLTTKPKSRPFGPTSVLHVFTPSAFFQSQLYNPEIIDLTTVAGGSHALLRSYDNYNYLNWGNDG